MSYIKAVIGGKDVGIADQASIEPMYGCANGCEGCYAKKTSRMGEKFHHPIIKDFNHGIFDSSCKSLRKKGISYVRMAKHCDAGNPNIRRTVYDILKVAQSNGLKVIFVTKSLEPDQNISQLMKEGNHILHISLGMKTTIMHSFRVNSFNYYKREGVKTFLRITEDTTRPMPLKYYGYNSKDIILTPMRYSSINDLNSDEANKDLFEYVSGFYRPKVMHATWGPMSYNLCGEIDKKIFCCNCGEKNEN